MYTCHDRDPTSEFCARVPPNSFRLQWGMTRVREIPPGERDCATDICHEATEEIHTTSAANRCY
jgi:hypothetical protein